MAKGQNPRRGQISFLLPQKFLGIKSGTMHVLTRDFYFDSSGKTRRGAGLLKFQGPRKTNQGKTLSYPPCHPMSFVLLIKQTFIKIFRQNVLKKVVV